MNSKKRISNESKSIRSWLRDERNSIFSMIWQSLFNERIGYCPNSKGDILIGSGFTLPNIVYLPVVNDFHSLGYNATIENNGGWLTRSNYERRQDLFLELAFKYVERHGPFDYFVGHSLSGLQGMILPKYFPRIKRVFSFSPPTNGGWPRMLANLGDRIGILVPEPMRKEITEDIIQTAQNYPEKIVTFSTPLDRLCPPEVSAFPNERATNIIIDPNEMIRYGYEKDIRHCTHVGLISSRFVIDHYLNPIILEDEEKLKAKKKHFLKISRKYAA